jgi:hypothetical protein
LARSATLYLQSHCTAKINVFQWHDVAVFGGAQGALDVEGAATEAGSRVMSKDCLNFRLVNRSRSQIQNHTSPLARLLRHSPIVNFEELRSTLDRPILFTTRGKSNAVLAGLVLNQ